MLVSVGLPASANTIKKDVGVNTKTSLNVSHRVVSPAGIAERTASLKFKLTLYHIHGLGLGCQQFMAEAPATTSLTAGIALDALEQALHERRLNPEDPLVHHSDRGVQYVSIRYTERLAEAGIEPSVGSRGDSYDNALAESIIGLYKTEVIHRRGPWRGPEDVEFATLEWVHWYNTQRLLEPIGNVAPVEYEMNYYRSQEGSLEMARLN